MPNLTKLSTDGIRLGRLIERKAVQLRKAQAVVMKLEAEARELRREMRLWVQTMEPLPEPGPLDGAGPEAGA